MKKPKPQPQSLTEKLHQKRGSFLRLIANPLPHPKVEEGESLDIKGYSQLDSYSCGAVAGWMVLQALHPHARFRDFYAHSSPTPEDGLTTEKLVRALRKSGVGVSVKEEVLSFELIVKTIQKGFPIIAVVDRPGREVAHWVVVYGYAQTGSHGKRWVYLAGNNFWGIHHKSVGGPNPSSYADFSKLSQGFESLICWGKPMSKPKSKEAKCIQSLNNENNTRYPD